jgi:RNA-binding protein 26
LPILTIYFYLQAIAAIKKNQDMLEATSQLIKEADVKRMESVKKSSEIAKSKQDLLEKYIEEQKRIITLMEERKATIKPEEKSAMMGMLKMLTQKIEVAKEEVKQNITVRPKAPSELQKDLLDAELELMQAKNDGSENVGEMQKRVNQLRFEAAKMGYPPTSRGGGISRGRGRGYAPRGYAPRGMYGRGSPRGSFFRGGRGRGGRGFHAMTTVDRRPSKIAVMGFEEGEKDEVVAHFQKFGEVVESMEDEASGAIVVHFKTRRFAEVAMGGGQQFGAKELQLAW